MRSAAAAACCRLFLHLVSGIAPCEKYILTLSYWKMHRWYYRVLNAYRLCCHACRIGRYACRNGTTLSLLVLALHTSQSWHTQSTLRAHARHTHGTHTAHCKKWACGKERLGHHIMPLMVCRHALWFFTVCRVCAMSVP